MKKICTAFLLPLFVTSLSACSYKYDIAQAFNNFFETENTFVIADTTLFRVNPTALTNFVCNSDDVVKVLLDNFEQLQYEKITPDDNVYSFLSSDKTHVISSIDLPTNNNWNISFDSKDIYVSFSKKADKEHVYDCYHCEINEDKGSEILKNISLEFAWYSIYR